MKRFAAFLRGVSPMNCKMSELAKAFTQAGFTDVKTLLSSGNVVFTASGSEPAIQKRAEAAMQEHLGRSFLTFVRSVDHLQSLLDANPYASFELDQGAKRVVTLLSSPPAAARLPIEFGDAKILCVRGREVFSTYVPGPKGPVFMTLLERTFGKDVTTRTWDTLRKVRAAG